MTTTVETAIGVSIREAATTLGLSPNAVRMRIRHKTLPAFKEGDQWRVLLDRDVSNIGWSPASDRQSRPPSSPMSVETDHPLVTAFAQAQLAAVIREAVAPFIEELGKVQHQLGATEQELVQERARLKHLEHEYDMVKKEIVDLRLLAGATDHKQVSTNATQESLISRANVAPVGAEREPEVFPKQRWPWWMRILAGK